MMSNKEAREQADKALKERIDCVKESKNIKVNRMEGDKDEPTKDTTES